MKKQSSLVVVPDADKGTAGLITWWKLVDSDAERLRKRWTQDVGWSEKFLPDPPTAGVALRRALKLLYENATTRVQTCPGGTYAIVNVSYEDDDDKRKNPVFETSFKVWQHDGELHYSNCDDTKRRTIWKAYQTEFQCLSSRDLSSWLVGLADQAGAVRLRESGGIYFIPSTHVSWWESVSSAVEAASANNCVYAVPALKTESAVRAILSALETEARAAVDQMQADLDERGAGKRALASRREACAALVAKVSSYEQLLGKKLTDLTGLIRRMDSKIAEVMLAED